MLEEKELKANLIYNNKLKKVKVLNEINKNLESCDSFAFSVAFINDSGLQCIKQSLFDLEEKGIKGKLITSTYLGFNSPKTFKELLKFKEIEVRIFDNDGFHPKGYIFNLKDEKKIIIGSSNLTASALTTNQEWNICLSSFANSDIVKRIDDEFNEQWENAVPLTNEWIDAYSKVYKPVKQVPFSAKQIEKVLEPNLMQTEALASLERLRREGKDKALLISATGTGKTFLSAFDVKQFNANRALFVVHRENIAKTALESFRRIMPNKKYGMFSGNNKNTDCDYMFSTIQTIGKEEYLKQFQPDYFDYIIIDEVHHLGAEFYQTLFKYFKPKFLLGMTATPERTDGYDIYKDFDYNIAYEIRLQQAMEEDLLCPFHYFGIADFELNGQTVDDFSDVNYLTCEERVKHIINASEKYSYSGDKIHGLIFVSRVDEAKKISSILNEKGYKTAAISGESTNIEESIDMLESDDKTNYYDYLVCVDKFNEGIDIPKVNQVILARPTGSPIVFVQQLGRGLRKADGKEYTVIIDMIGNYKNNFMIPVALSGKRTYVKSDIGQYVISGKQYLPGSSTVSFSTIAKKKIFASIDNLSRISNLIKQSYETLLFRLGRRPYLIDFYKEQEIDPILIIQNKKSYYNLAKQNDESMPEFTDEMIETLEYLSRTILNGKRDVELLMLKTLIESKEIGTVELFNRMNNLTVCGEKEFDSSINVLSGGFEQKDETVKHNEIFRMIESDDLFTKLTGGFRERLNNQEFYKEIMDIIETGLSYYEDNYQRTDDYPLVLNKKYSRRDVCRLFNHPRDIASVMYGLHVFNDDACIFVTYNKQDPKDEKNYVEGKPNYADSFIDEYRFEWMTQLGKDSSSTYYQSVKNPKTRRLFIQKIDSEKDFYYMGKVNIISVKDETKEDNNGNNKPISRVQFFMENHVEKELLDYFENYKS